MKKILIIGFVLMPLLLKADDYKKQNSVQEEQYVDFAETMPEPIGGLEAIYKNIKYPDMARKAGIQGRVYAIVFVNEEGEVEDVKVLKGIGGGCDEAAIDGIKKSKFKPGSNGGIPVKVKLSIPIAFKL
jgi:protein TonB